MSTGPRKIVTLRDVAREAKVSIAAASYALSGGGTIGEDVRARVKEIAKRLDYRPNRSAQAVRTGRSRTLGLIVPDLRNPFYPALAQSIEHAARQAGYTVLLFDSSGVTEDEAEGLRHLQHHGVAGAIWCETSRDDAVAAEAFATPVVVIGSPRMSLDNVTADDVTGGRLAARHLLAQGHRRIGILSGAAVPLARDDRRRGFLEAIGEAAEIVWEVQTPYAVDLSGEGRERLATRDVSAVMCGNDLIAVGVLRAAHQLGIAVPADLSVIGFDDIPWAAIVVPALTTIQQPVADMAATALTLLLDRLDDPGRPVRHVKVDVRLVVRDSVGPAP